MLFLRVVEPKLRLGGTTRQALKRLSAGSRLCREPLPNEPRTRQRAVADGTPISTKIEYRHMFDGERRAHINGAATEEVGDVGRSSKLDRARP